MRDLEMRHIAIYPSLKSETLGHPIIIVGALCLTFLAPAILSAQQSKPGADPHSQAA